jgi:ribosomal protein S18 acetylase RimI-like enzyme
MTGPTQLEVLDLRHFSARQLRPLLEAEAQVWEQRLRWNYRSSTELLLQYIDTRVLPGYVALENGRVYGFTFCVYEGSKAVVGDAFAVDAPHHKPLEIIRTLLRHLLELLEAAPDVQRIESQLLLYDPDSVREAFVQQGFSAYTRLFMESPLASTAMAGGKNPHLPPDLQLRRWTAGDYQSAAELIHASYMGHVDGLINDQYRSLHGSLRFLHNIVRFPGCGVFEGEQSWVVEEIATRRLVGMLLCSRVADAVAHITQLCVAPESRGRGIALVLLHQCMQQLRRAGYEAITLTVTEDNSRAVRLYEQHAFTTRHRFDAVVSEKPRRSA